MRGKSSGRGKRTKEAEEGTVSRLRKTHRAAGDGAPSPHGSPGAADNQGAPRGAGSGTGASSALESSIERGTALGLGSPVLTEQTITPAELASIPSAASEPSSSGAEAAAAALELDAPAETEALEELAPNPEGVIELAEAGLGLLCLFFARQGAPAQLEDPAHFTESERSMLRIFAPAAAPYLGSVSNQAPQVSAVAFVGCLGTILWGRFRALRAELKAKKEEARPEPTTTQSSGSAPRTPTATDRIEHQKRWGAAADALPVGSVPKDAGLPPRFRPVQNGRAAS